MNTVIYIVRHGETEHNVNGIIQGHTDSALTSTGVSQAKKLGQIFADVHFDEVFSSDLLRAKRTAEIITLERNLMVKTTQLLRERSFGRHEGISYRGIKVLFEKFERLTDEEKYHTRVDADIESDEEIVSRFITFLREVAVGFENKTILVVTHGGMMRTLLIHLGFGSYRQLRPGTVRNTAYIKLESDGVDFFIKETFGVEKYG